MSSGLVDATCSLTQIELDLQTNTVVIAEPTDPPRPYMINFPAPSPAEAIAAILSRLPFIRVATTGQAQIVGPKVFSIPLTQYVKMTPSPLVLNPNVALIYAHGIIDGLDLI